MNPGKQFTQHRRVIHKGLTTDVQYICDVQEQASLSAIFPLHLPNSPVKGNSRAPRLLAKGS